MRILFLNRVFPPANGATGDLLAELCLELIKKGHSTTVITSGDPTTLTRASDCIHSLSVQRVAGLPFTRASNWRRALSYASLYPAFLWRALRLPRHQVIVTLTDPPLHLLLGPLIRFFKRGQLVHWAQDIYPELAEKLGVLQPGGWGARLLRMFSTWALKRHDVIIAVGRCMRERLIQRGVAPNKIVVIPNWAQTTLISRAASPPPTMFDFRAEHGLADKFVVMYSGNFGLAHAFEALVSAVTKLELHSPDVMFVFVGDGPRLPWLKEQLNGRKNVLFLPFQPREKLENSLRAADVHIASMRQDLFGLVVPSKVYGVLAAGRPCLFIGPGGSEVAQIILEQNCGWVVSNSCAASLAELIAALPAQRDSLKQMGHRAEHSQQQNTPASAASMFEKLFIKLNTQH